MEAYSNCRQFNCVTPIVEQAEYHMFNREKAELFLPELYNKIGVGLMAWGPLSMSLSENNERLMFTTKGSLRNKSQSYSWTEDELNKEVHKYKFFLSFIFSFHFLLCLCPKMNISQTFSALISWLNNLTIFHFLFFYFFSLFRFKDRMDETRRHIEKLRELGLLAEKLGCSLTQLSIAWSLKHEPVQCLLIGAVSTEQLHTNLQALQLLPRLSPPVMLEIDKIIDNKPVRPLPISTLALR